MSHKRLPRGHAPARPSRPCRSRPSPCARCLARRSRRSARRARPTAPTGSSLFSFASASRSRRAGWRSPARRAQITEQIAAAGHALLGLKVDQQQAAPRVKAPRLVPSTNLGGTSTGVARMARTVRIGNDGVWHENPSIGASISAASGRFCRVLEPLTRPAHIRRDRTAVCRPAGSGCHQGPVKVASTRTLRPCHEFRHSPARSCLGFEEIERVLDRVAKGVRRLSALQHRTARARRREPGTAAHHARRRRLHPRSTRCEHRGKPIGDPRAAAGRQEPAISPPRHRRAPIPAHLRAGGRHGGAWARISRTGCCRSICVRPEPGTDREDHLDQRTRMTKS